MSEQSEKNTTNERPIPHRAVLGAIFVVYVITRYPDVGGRINMGDSAKFQFLARTLGIGHSPGNPLYLAASALWVRLPLPFDDATKVTLFSSVAAIVTIALASAAVARLDLAPVLRRPLVLEARSFAAILLGLGSLFWTLATEAEVYTLGSIFVAGVMLGVARWTKDHRPRDLYLAIGSLGLGLANHLTIAALGPALLYVLFREAEGRAALRSVRFWGVCIGGLVLAVVPYGWIAWRVSHGPLAYSEYPGPLDAKTFLGFVTARGVMDATYAKTTYLTAVLERLPDLFAQLQKQWCWPLLLFLPLGAIRLFRTQATFAAFVVLAVLGHFLVAIVFRIPDPEGLFVPVSVLLAVPLALAPAALAIDLRLPDRGAIAMLFLHGVLAVAHVSTWYRHPFSAYIQQTPEGLVVLDYPTLHEVLPDNAMIGVPCGHYGCVEVTSYYQLVDPELRAKHASFVRFAWSEWDESKLSVPLVDPRTKQDRPICVVLANDLAKLREMGFAPTAIPRAPVKVLGRRFASAPLYCVSP